MAAPQDTLRVCVEQQVAVANTQVEGALYAQIHQTQGHLMAVTRRLSKVQREVQHLRDHLVKLRVNMQETEQPLKTTIKRHPSNSGDTADQILDKEAVETKSMATALDQGYTEMKSTLDELEAMERVLVKQAQWLRRSMMRDNECVTSAPCRRVKKNGKTAEDFVSDLGSESTARASTTASRLSQQRTQQGKPDGTAAPEWVRGVNGVKELKLPLRPGTSTAHPQAPKPPKRPTTGSCSGSSTVSSVAPFKSYVEPFVPPKATGLPEQREAGKNFFLGARRRIAAGPAISGVKGRSDSSFSDILGDLTWAEGVNQAYSQAQALVDRSIQLRLRLSAEVAKRQQRCSNVRKQVLDSIEESVTKKMEGKHRMLNTAKRLENDIHTLKKEWKNTSETAAKLATPIMVIGERQHLRGNIPDRVGVALDQEKVTVQEGRTQLKAKCKVILQTLISQEKEKNALYQKAKDVEADIKVERACMKSDNPMSTGHRPVPPTMSSKRVGLDPTRHSPAFDY